MQETQTDSYFTPATRQALNGIVGHACRVPGANSPSDLWKLIREQRDVRRTIPSDRFNLNGWSHPHGPNKGTVSVVQLLHVNDAKEDSQDECAQWILFESRIRRL